MNGSSLTTLTDNGFVSVIVLPDQHSRHNTPAKSWSLFRSLKKSPISKQTTIISLASKETYLAISIAMWEDFLYIQKDFFYSK